MMFESKIWLLLPDDTEIVLYFYSIIKIASYMTHERRC